ncbi:epoxide hydrolase family protein [Novosphingobium taihuense]|uniref:Pimeloyl-ACP methyl ester carboxylesterase n=1 Tax=Novosphingobium taihuense TaxID=260085 RepID=A0A7W7ADK0_9SPHN|nr:epoxide hydrolase family protein [Novosphingobium taihuense]MBB4614295.1 pimeloyl-ACP methyl ester carboxylesterase [Novosphingobium taihuense]TWH87142.1 microsomal epoxide hydrolase [Novosphingobium taihuense]
MEPYSISISEERLGWIRDRVSSYDWAQFPDAGGWSAGMGVDALRQIMERWTGGYDWRAEERKLNVLPHFIAEIDGIQIHFLHFRSGAPAGRPPIVLLHGWPGSFLEFIEAAPRLASPELFGGHAGDGFDLIIPSLPGYGFSGPPAKPIGTRDVARIMHKLVTEILEYDRYLAQGGDWGSTVSAWMAHDYPAACIGLHLNMVIMGHAGLKYETDEERAYRNLQAQYREFDGGYAHQQRTKPQTLGFALQDSPVGAAAWILEKFAAWSDLPRPDGQPQLGEAYSIDHLLTNIMLYVATGAITTSTWLYLGNTLGGSFPLDHPVAVPTAIAAFPDPVFAPPPRSLAQKSYNIVRWTDMPRGGHFAAMEQPALFADDVRSFALSICAAGL